jgi:hypothetical protein
MTRIWRYVLAADNGMAPCAQDGVLTLTCCKPLIRREAAVGDYVMGFLPKRFGRGRLAYVGRIASRLPLADYQRRSPDRYDAIYRGVLGPGGQETLEPLRQDYHPDMASRHRDASGVHSLRFDPYWYWGGVGVLLPEDLADMAHYYVGQSARGSTPERVEALQAWLAEMGPPGTWGSSREAPKTSVLAAPAKARRRSC